MSNSIGFLIPSWYVVEKPSYVNMNISSVLWGFSLSIGLFSAVEATTQTFRTWKRTRRLTAYVIMIWVNWTASMVMGSLGWYFQMGYIKPSFWIFFFVVFFWVFQVQLLYQIIINRIGLLMINRSHVTRLKWSVFAITLVINITVFVVWIPARLQINKTWEDVNNVWDRAEKAIFCVIDAGLNLYFIRLVRTRLIDNGLKKYIPLYQLNLALVSVSMVLNLVLIGLMSLSESLVYLQFHPVAYLLKLQIEMTNAKLIAKVVRSTTSDANYSGSGPKSTHVALNSTTGKKPSRGTARAQNLTFTDQHETYIESGRPDAFERRSRAEPGRDKLEPDLGIRKTVETVVNREPRQGDIGNDSDLESQSSSTRKLHYHNHVSGKPPR